MPAERSTASTLAPAKVNLALHVGPKRPDGFHELVTIFQAVSLADEVEVELVGGRRPGDAVGGESPAVPSIRLSVDGPDLGPDEENLAWRAADAFMARTGYVGEVAIRLRKAIPAGAGLGGGSSDAAAVLRCLDALTGLKGGGLLTEIGADLGSDVVFFLGGAATAIGRGRGERLFRVEALPGRPIAIALPPVHVATGPAYAALARSRAGGDSPTLPELSDRVSWEALLAGAAHNDFERTVASAHPEVAESLATLRASGARLAMLSGSGAASFGLFEDGVPDGEVDRRCAEASERLGWPVISCVTLDRMPKVAVT